MIEVNNQTKAVVDENMLRRIAQAVLVGEKRQDMDLSIALVGEKRSRELNRVYRGKDKAADVLSFKEPEIGLGEVILTPVKIRKDAAKYGITFTDYLARMLVHGILHLLKYHHEESEKAARLMDQKEKQYFRLLNIRV